MREAPDIGAMRFFVQQDQAGRVLVRANAKSAIIVSTLVILGFAATSVAGFIYFHGQMTGGKHDTGLLGAQVVLIATPAVLLLVNTIKCVQMAQMPPVIEYDPATKIARSATGAVVVDPLLRWVITRRSRGDSYKQM